MLKRRTSREGTGASSPDAQTVFMEMVGFLESADSYSSLVPVLTSTDAEILSSALNHEYRSEIHWIEDKFFTLEEFKKLAGFQSEILSTYLPKFEAALSEEKDSKVDVAALVEEYLGRPAVCRSKKEERGYCYGHLSSHQSNRCFRPAAKAAWSNWKKI